MRATITRLPTDDELVARVTRAEKQARDLWVEPAFIGTGVGSTLWRHMLGEARRLAYTALRIESDPSAAPFYRKLGARETGSMRSTIVEGRVLPVFEIALP